MNAVALLYMGIAHEEQMAAGRDDRERKKQVGKRVPKRVQRMNNKIPIVEEHGINGGKVNGSV